MELRIWRSTSVVIAHGSQDHIHPLYTLHVSHPAEVNSDRRFQILQVVRLSARHVKATAPDVLRDGAQAQAALQGTTSNGTMLFHSHGVAVGLRLAGKRCHVLTHGTRTGVESSCSVAIFLLMRSRVVKRLALLSCLIRVRRLRVELIWVSCILFIPCVVAVTHILLRLVVRLVHAMLSVRLLSTFLSRFVLVNAFLLILSLGS